MTTEDPNQKTMSLLDHLIELRTRFVYSLAVVFIAFLLCYAVSEHLFRFLAQPLADIFAGQDRRMIFTGLTEGFFTYLKISLWGALFLAFPFILLQAWSFIAPGLYHQEKKAFLPFMIATPFLFFLGGALVYYLVFPLAWKFFLSFETPALENNPLAHRTRSPYRRILKPSDDPHLRLRNRLPAPSTPRPLGTRRINHHTRPHQTP